MRDWQHSIYTQNQIKIQRFDIKNNMFEDNGNDCLHNTGVMKSLQEVFTRICLQMWPFDAHRPFDHALLTTLL